MGAKLKTTNLEYAPSLNWLLALAAAGLAMVFAVRNWAYPPLLGLLFGALTGGIATLNLAPHETYLRSLQARQVGRRTGLLIVAGQFLSLVWLWPALATNLGGRSANIGDIMAPALLSTLFSGLATLLVAIVAGIYGARQSGRISHWRPPAYLNQPADLHEDWVKEIRPVAANQFSPGANHDFGWYFEGELKESIRSLDELLAFLKKCEYVADRHLFMREDFWQHPVTFEQIRKGDCEDSALWAWRRFKELGYPAELVSGLFLETGTHHAWVNVLIDGQPFVCETTRKRSHPLIPLAEAATAYRPFVSVDHEYNTFRYAGAAKRNVRKEKPTT
ncbi:MAG: hypothetical protein KDE09_09535 [Anaerolineales bacterium]|nr:hypothetical protein [Anaerolineales bacterium]